MTKSREDLSKRLEKAHEEIQLLRRKIENHIIMSEEFKTEYNTWLDKLNKEVDDGTGKSGQI